MNVGKPHVIKQEINLQSTHLPCRMTQQVLPNKSFRKDFVSLRTLPTLFNKTKENRKAQVVNLGIQL